MLIGNYSVLNKSPGRWFGGNSTAHASGVGQSVVYNRSNWGTTGAMRCAALPQDSTTSLELRSIPDGYSGTGWLMPITEGGMSSHNLVAGVGDIADSNLAGGLNAVAELTGSGTISSAVGQLIVSALASLSGSGGLTASMVGALNAAAALSGEGGLTATIKALASMLAALTASGSITATVTASGELEASITVTGATLTTANVGSAVWSELLEAGFDASQVLRIIAATSAGKSSGGPDSTVFRNLGDTQDQVSGDADTSGNRTSVTYGD